MIRRLGRGKYSEVFEGVDTRDGKKVAIKILKPGKIASYQGFCLIFPLVRKSKIMREIKILESIRGGKYVVNLYRPCYDKMSKSICLVKIAILDFHWHNRAIFSLLLTLSDS